jgi:hypothetical protein
MECFRLVQDVLLSVLYGSEQQYQLQMLAQGDDVQKTDVIEQVRVIFAPRAFLYPLH